MSMGDESVGLELTNRSSSDAELVLEAVIPAATPREVFSWWTQPDKLRRWWPPEVTLDLREGGAYHFAWPNLGWHLRGVFETVSPPEQLAFTWSWDHDAPEQPERRVVVSLEAEGDATLLRIAHGPYGEGASEAEDRASHHEGWSHFCGVLAREIARA